MEDILAFILKAVLIVAGVLLLAFIVSAVGAIILVWLWPLVMPAVFPGLVASGAIASNISFWTAFGLMFICSLLFKPSSSNSKSDNK